MAKGIEDTTFYRWHRLIALNEVGGDPRALDTPDAETLHAWARAQAARPSAGMTTLSTHDTKRSEDVRARLLASWPRISRAGTRPGRRFGTGGRSYHVDEPTAYLLFQTAARRLAARARSGSPVHGEGDRTRPSSSRPGTTPTRLRGARRATSPRAASTATSRRRSRACWWPTSAADRRASTLGTKLLQLTLPGRAGRLPGQRDRRAPRWSIPTIAARSTSARRAAHARREAVPAAPPTWAASKLWVTSARR